MSQVLVNIENCKHKDVPVRVRAVRVVTCCVVDSPVRVEFLRVACWICRIMLSRCVLGLPVRVACCVLRVGTAGPC